MVVKSVTRKSGRLRVREQLASVFHRVNGKVSFQLMTFAVLAVLAALAGCRQVNSTTDSGEAVQINMTVEPSPPTVGETVLIIILRDERENPIEGSVLQIRGDMTHAGMAPEFGEVESATEEEYRIPFEWTMSGDWILTVTATLPNGKTVEDTFEVTVE